jgi:multiple sugar transport system permease protein
MLSPVIFFNLVMGVIGAFQYFTQAYVMTPNGGPQDSTLFYSLYLFNRAWKYYDMGYASAMAWILFLIVVTLTAIVFRSQKKWVHYG